MRRAAALLRVSAATCTIAASLALASCGGDDEPEERSPARTAPSATETTAPAPPVQETGTSPAPQPETSTATTPEAVPERGGGAVAPEGTAPPPEDDEETPAERFEKYCDQNPGACG